MVGWLAGRSAGGLIEGLLLISQLHTVEGVGRNGSDSWRVDCGIEEARGSSERAEVTT